MGAFPAETAPACAQEPLLAGAEASRRVRRGHAGPSRVGISSMVLSRGRTPPPPNVGGTPGWMALPPGAPGPVSTARGPHHPGSHAGPRPGRPPPFSRPAVRAALTRPHARGFTALTRLPRLQASRLRSREDLGRGGGRVPLGEGGRSPLRARPVLSAAAGQGAGDRVAHEQPTLTSHGSGGRKSETTGPTRPGVARAPRGPPSPSRCVPTGRKARGCSRGSLL